MPIARVERDFVIQGAMCGARPDGRSNFDTRQVTLETGIINQASGSCRLKIAGGTHVLVGIKVQVGDVIFKGSDDKDEAFVNANNVGRIESFVECSPSAKAILDTRQVDDICIQYGQTLNHTLNGAHGGLDLAALCIIPGETCWVISVDVLILEYAGNVLDAVFMATRAALGNTRIPKVKVEEIDGDYDFAVEDEETLELPGYINVPICVTLNKVGNAVLVDASLLEEQCADANISVMVNKKGYLCGMRKRGDGCMDPSMLVGMIQNGQSLGEKHISSMDKFIKLESTRRMNLEEPIGFMY